MFYAYIIQSRRHTKQLYKGSTHDLKKRLEEHNLGQSQHTKKFKPWKLLFYCTFQDKQKALEFEKYLKTASGIAFMRKRLI